MKRIDLLRRHRAGAEDERVALLALVLLRVDVERLALHDGRTLDGLPRGAEDATEDDVDLIVLDELGRHRARDGVVGRAVLEMQLQLPPQQPALGVDVADDHPGDVGVGEPHEREGPVWSAMTPTLMGSAPADASMMSSFVTIVSICTERQ